MVSMHLSALSTKKVKKNLAFRTSYRHCAFKPKFSLSLDFQSMSLALSVTSMFYGITGYGKSKLSTKNIFSKYSTKKIYFQSIKVSEDLA